MCFEPDVLSVKHRANDGQRDYDAPERNVLEVMAEGYADDYIAQTLHLDRQKVEECAASIYQKLGLSEQEGSTMRNQAVEAFINQITATPYVLEREGTG